MYYNNLCNYNNIIIYNYIIIGIAYVGWKGFCMITTDKGGAMDDQLAKSDKIIMLLAVIYNYKNT